MTLNPNITQLDPSQILKRLYEEADDAIRIKPANSIELGVEVSAADGDSIHSFKGNLLQEVTYDSESTSPLAEQNAKGVSEINLHLKVVTAPDIQVDFKVQHSPSDSADLWIDTGLLLSALPGDTPGDIKSETKEALLSRRLRIISTIPQLNGTIESNTAADPTVITSTGHGLESGRSITISGSDSTPALNGSHIVTKIDNDTFSVPVNVTVPGIAGSWVTNETAISSGEILLILIGQ